LKKIIVLVTAVVAVFFFIASNKSEKETKLYTFNSISLLEGVNLSHVPGLYDSIINLEIKNSEGLYVELVNEDGVTRVQQTVTISKPSVLRIKKSINDTAHYFVGSYIVNVHHDLPVVSLVVNGSEFFPPDGIYVGTCEGTEDEGVQVFGKAWEKVPITGYAQFFFNGELKDELELDIKTYGGMTLGHKEKSLQLSARKEKHGQGKIKVKLFENLPFREFQHVVLRTSGNDQSKTRLKDMSISQVADDLNVNTKASRAAVIYINGTYWGIHNLREKVNEDYFKERYNWKSNEFVEIQGSGSSNDRYMKFNDDVRNWSSTSDFANKLSDSLDIEEFFNFHILQTYISNVDYRGNIRFFKHKNGRWKWLLYDTDLSCGMDFLNRNFIQDRTFPTTEYWYNPPYATTLLHTILGNKELKKKFVKQYTFLLATKLKLENFESKIDRNAFKISSEMERHFMRRNHLYGETRSRWETNLNNLKAYFRKRPESTYRHLKAAFNLSSEPVQIDITQNTKNINALSMNASSIKVSEINGKFFPELSLDINAESTNHMYQFVNWSDGETNATRTISPSENFKLTANYKHVSKSDWAGKLVLKKYYVNNNWDEPLIFTTFENLSKDNINLNGFTVYEDASGASIQLNEKEIKSGEVKILANDVELFKNLTGRTNLDVIPFLTEQTFKNDVKLCMLDGNGACVDSLYAVIDDKHLIDHGSYIVEKKADSLEINHIKLDALKELEFTVDSVETAEDSVLSRFSGAVLWVVVGVTLILSVLFFFIWKRKKAKTKIPAEAGIQDLEK
jgi:hypothetical protein